MTDASMTSAGSPARRDSWRDIIVFGSMTVVAIALGVALHLHADVPPPIAAVAALAAQVVMVSAHLASLALIGSPARRPRRQRIEPTTRTAAAPAAASPGPPSAAASPASSPVATPPAATPSAATRPAPDRFEPVALPEQPHAAAPRPAARHILDVRPGEPWLAGAGAAPSDIDAVSAVVVETAANAPGATTAASSEAIERAIRGLAAGLPTAGLPTDRVDAVTEVAETAADVVETVAAAARTAIARTTIDSAETARATAPPSLPVDAIAQSVEALRSAASAMREPAAARAAAIEDPALAARRRLAEIASAVERESI